MRFEDFKQQVKIEENERTWRLTYEHEGTVYTAPWQTKEMRVVGAGTELGKDPSNKIMAQKVWFFEQLQKKLKEKQNG